MLDSGPTVTFPITTAVAARKASGWMTGLTPRMGMITANGSPPSLRVGHRSRRHLAEPGPQDLRLGGLEDLDLDTLAVDDLTALGDVSQLLEDEAVQRAVLELGQRDVER